MASCHFPIQCERLVLFSSHGQRFAFWTDEARALLHGLKTPVYRVPRGSGITLKCPDYVLVAADRSAKEKELVDLIVQSGEAEQHIVVFCKCPFFLTLTEDLHCILRNVISYQQKNM